MTASFFVLQHGQTRDIRRRCLNYWLVNQTNELRCNIINNCIISSQVKSNSENQVSQICSGISHVCSVKDLYKSPNKWLYQIFHTNGRKID